MTALAQPKTIYKTLRDNLLVMFREHITELNYNLTESTRFTNANANLQIKSGDPLVTVVDNRNYPCLFVKIISKSEQFDHLGHAGRKRPIVTFRIFALTKSVNNMEQDNEIMQLASNIEGVIRDHFDIFCADTQFLFSELRGLEFGYGETNNNTYIDILSIDLDCYLEVK